MKYSPESRLVEAHELAALLAAAGDPGTTKNPLIVDVSSRENYLNRHVPGAVHLDYGALQLGQPPAPGQLPPPHQLQAALRAIGLTAERRVIAYDDQGGGRAGRLLWTLEAVGHHHWSLLNGGLAAWANDGQALENGARRPSPGDFSIAWNAAVIADKNDVLAAVDDPDTVILDARSAAEYAGVESASSRRGHIPGAVHLDWRDTMAPDLRLKPADALRAMLAQRGITGEQKIIVHCQTHHRSSHSFVVLRWLGFDAVRGYPGSWSEWSNDPSLPIES